jgi:hypothetical protein
MGYFVPHRIGDLADEPAVTPREYGCALYSALQRVVQNAPRECAAYERGIALLVAGRPNAAARAFASFVRLCPENPVGHRMLGQAYLGAGHFVTGLGHLVIALRILRRDEGTTITLRDGLRLHLEAALVRLLLLPLCGRLGDREAVKQLMFESLTL